MALLPPRLPRRLYLLGGWTLARSLSNEHILAHRMSAMILGLDNPWLLIGLTAAIGGLMGGLGGLCGSLFMALIHPSTHEFEHSETQSEVEELTRQ